MYYLPPQEVLQHEVVWVGDPVQSFPPWYGPILDLETVIVPVPHDFEHELPDPQGAHVQSTENYNQIFLPTINSYLASHAWHFNMKVLIDEEVTRCRAGSICIAWSWLCWWSCANFSTIIWFTLGPCTSHGARATCQCTSAPRSPRVPCAVH